MRASRVLIVAIACLLVAPACASSQLSSRERLHVELRYAKAQRQTAVSMFVSPFFRDSTRRLLSVHPPEERILLADPQGETILPGRAEEVLAAGTRVTVVAVRFPGGWEGFSRPLMTPRDRPWVELRVDDRPGKPVFVLVLSPDLKTEGEVVEEVNRLLTTDPIDTQVATLTALEQELVRTKTLVPGVGPRALELAWGTANVRRSYPDGEVRVQEWTWRSDTAWRKVVMRDDVVTTVEFPDDAGGAKK